MACFLADLPHSIAEGDGRVGSFMSLAASDVVQVHFESTGCFESEGYELTIRGGDSPSVVLRETGTKWRGPMVPPNAENTRPIALSRDELRSLDAILSFYREGQPGACTTTDTITMTHYRSGRLLATERFVDFTCGAPRPGLGGLAGALRWRVFQRRVTELHQMER